MVTLYSLFLSSSRITRATVFFGHLAIFIIALHLPQITRIELDPVTLALQFLQLAYESLLMMVTRSAVIIFRLPEPINMLSSAVSQV